MMKLTVGKARANKPGGSLVRVLAGEVLSPPPVWLMRQAGRYLPEYRTVRRRAGSFLDLCYSPALAAEVSLQPVRRFGLDAAILFSDILVVPDALGQRVRFDEGRGPLLDPIGTRMAGALDERGAAGRLDPVIETVGRVRAELDEDRALIGFCGAPWTVATYMVAGVGTPDQAPARLMALRDAEGFAALIETLVRVSAHYLIAQLGAGADVVQIFDTWAGALDGEGFKRFAVEPVAAIVARVRRACPGAKVIVFAKGVGAGLGAYASQTGADAVGVDWAMPMKQAVATVPPRVAVQGNLDPVRLLAGGEALEAGVDEILAAARGRAHIFNLGHGIMPRTPPEHVAALVARVRRTDPCSG